MEIIFHLAGIEVGKKKKVIRRQFFWEDCWPKLNNAQLQRNQMKSNSLNSHPEYDLLSSTVTNVENLQVIPHYKLSEPNLSIKMTQK